MSGVKGVVQEIGERIIDAIFDDHGPNLHRPTIRPGRPPRAPRGTGTSPSRNSPIVDEPKITVYHQGELENGAVSGTRPLWVGTLPDLQHYHPDGQLFQFNIPQSVYQDWLDNQIALPFTDYHQPTGIYTPSIRILPPGSGQMNDFLIPPRRRY
jgi:hypothetical protein